MARKYGLPVRLTEINTLSNAGLYGTSNVFVAALWSLDAAFEVISWLPTMLSQHHPAAGWFGFGVGDLGGLLLAYMLLALHCRWH